MFQGAGVGMLMPTLSKGGFGTLDAALWPKGSWRLSLASLYGGANGIALVNFFHDNTQAVQAAFDGVIGQFEVMMIAIMAASPLVLLLRSQSFDRQTFDGRKR